MEEGGGRSAIELLFCRNWKSPVFFFFFFFSLSLPLPPRAKAPPSIRPLTMALISSKTLIQAHAIFLFVLAVYLTKSPEVITESDVVLLLGEATRVVRAYPHYVYRVYVH